MSGFQTPITINDAMYSISRNAYVLPAFQRDFLWDAERIERLFDSLMRGCPTSSMLLWKIEGDANPPWKFYRFLTKYVSDARNYVNTNELYYHEGNNDYFAVLDGQQRLTAMRIGLYGTYAYHERNKSKDYSETSFPCRRLYLRLLKNTESEYQLQYVFSFLKDADTKAEVLYTDKQGHLWFKVSELGAIHNSEDGIDGFCDDQDLDREQRKVLRRLNTCVYEDRCINYYLEDKGDADRAVNIFNRINAGGVPLDFSDIIFSLVVANWSIDAKNEFKNLVNQVNNKGFKINKDYVIKAFLYLYHKNVKMEISSFSIDFCQKIEANWNNIRDSILSLFDLLRTFGLDEYKLTSVNATLPILYYIYHKNIFTNFCNLMAYKDERGEIKKWLLAMIVRRPFGAHTDAVLTQSRRAFTEDIDVAFLSDIHEFPVDKIMQNLKTLHALNDEFFDELFAIQKDDKYAFAILALLYPALDYKNNDFHKDHIHPADRYEELSDPLKAKYPFVVYNSILNLQMLDSNENESKGKKKLAQWVDEQTAPETRAAFLKTHLIPDVDLSLDNFEEYIERRKEMLKDKLMELLSESADA